MRSKEARMIRKYRRKNMMSQDELAGNLGVTPDQLQQWECGSSVPDEQNYRKLAHIFEVSPAVLTYGHNNDAVYKKHRRINWLLVLLLLMASIEVYLLHTQKEISWESLLMIPSLCILAFLFVIIFRFCIRNHDYHMLSGYDLDFDCDESNVNEMLVSIQYDIVTGTIVFEIFIFTALYLHASTLIEGMLFLFAVFFFIIDILYHNQKYQIKLELDQSQIQAMKVEKHALVLFLLLFFFLILNFLFVFELKGIRNNTIEALRIAFPMVVGIAVDSTWLLYSMTRIKKKIYQEKRWKYASLILVNLVLDLSIWYFS